jgi:pimeloyl-ACP methyl ester carboxylesterase
MNRAICSFWWSLYRSELRGTFATWQAASISLIFFGLAIGLPSVAAEKWSTPQDREFRSELDGSLQRYVELLPEPFDEKQEHHLLIALHGHGSDRWQYIRQERGECAGARDASLKYGLIFLSPDYRAPDSWMGPAAEADLVQIIREARGRYRIGKVILGGGSMGGTSVLIFAALHPDLVDGVVSQNGTANMLEYERFQDSIIRSYGGTKQAKPDEYRKRSAEFAGAKLTMPVAFTTGGQDNLVPPASVLRLAEQLRMGADSNVLLLHRETGGHATNYEDTLAAYEFVIQRAGKRMPE